MLSARAMIASAHHDAARLEKRIASCARGRWICVFLAVVLPIVPYLLFEHQARRLDALADHGKTIAATVGAPERVGKNVYLHYAYTVDDVTHTWAVKAADAPYAEGDTFDVLYLPEDPSLTRPGTDTEKVRLEALSNRSFTRDVVLGIFGFFVLMALIVEAQLRALRKRAL
jgi:hypothetical protein